MSNVFEGYERQYCELSANLAKKCTAAGALNGEQKKQKVSEVKAGIDEAEALIRKMDLEARSLQPNIKGVLLAKLREYKSDLNNLKSEVKKIVSGNLNPSARDELLESGMADAMTASADQRTRLMVSTERLNKTSDRVKDSRRTMLETEELGVSILQDLHSQRQSLLHAHNTLHGVDDNIGKSKKILTNMSRRMNKNKWVIGGPRYRSFSLPLRRVGPTSLRRGQPQPQGNRRAPRQGPSLHRRGQRSLHRHDGALLLKTPRLQTPP